jgi:hypothetical protein
MRSSLKDLNNIFFHKLYVGWKTDRRPNSRRKTSYDILTMKFAMEQLVFCSFIDYRVHHRKSVAIIILLYYFTFLKRGSTLCGATFMAPKSWHQNYLSQSHFEDDFSPYISRSDPPKQISILYYINSRYSINKLLRNLTPLWQHVLLLYNL